MSPSTENQPEHPSAGRSGQTSDLIGVKVTLWIALWFVAILVAFFFIGAVTGIVVIIAGAVLSLLALVKAIRGAELP